MTAFSWFFVAITVFSVGCAVVAWRRPGSWQAARPNGGALTWLSFGVGGAAFAVASSHAVGTSTSGVVCLVGLAFTFGPPVVKYVRGRSQPVPGR